MHTEHQDEEVKLITEGSTNYNWFIAIFPRHEDLGNVSLTFSISDQPLVHTRHVIRLQPMLVPELPLVWSRGRHLETSTTGDHCRKRKNIKFQLIVLISPFRKLSPCILESNAR